MSAAGKGKDVTKERSWFCLQISLIKLLEFMFEVKSTDNKNIARNNITLLVFFCQLVKSLRCFSAVSSRSCSKWATNGSPLPVVRNQKLKGSEKSLKPLESNLFQIDWVKVNWLKYAVIVFLIHCWCPRIGRCQHYLQKKELNDNWSLNLSSSILPHLASWDCSIGVCIFIC